MDQEDGDARENKPEGEEKKEEGGKQEGRHHKDRRGKGKEG